MLRGIARCLIFLDDADRVDFLGRLARLVPELGFVCFAWALMPNHVHLVLRSGGVRISRLMARLGTGYARTFNERHGRVGHLFQNRFRSRLVLDDADLAGVVAYVLRNPLADGLVRSRAELERFAWCGLGALVGRTPARPFEAAAAALALFGDDPAAARAALRWRMDAAPAAEEVVETPPQVTPASRLPPHPRGGDFAALRAEVCSALAVTSEALDSRCRNQRLAAARAELARRAATELGLSGAEIARRLGVTTAAVHVMLERASRRSHNNLTS